MANKVNILTHPLVANYGGLLQAYALQRVLSGIEFPSVIFDHAMLKESESTGFLGKVADSIRLLELRLGIRFRHTRLVPDCYRKIGRRFHRFLNRKFYRNLADCEGDSDALRPWVVGSDQVWRCEYANFMQSIPTYFLSFLPSEVRRKSIAYAASFGTDVWEGTPEETEACRNLLQQFKAVSVREHSGVNICRDIFGVEAVQMPDPTLLATPDDYAQLIQSEKTRIPGKSYLAAYVLDSSPQIKELLTAAGCGMSRYLQSLMPDIESAKCCDRFPISVAQWLRYIRDCEYFITDSFHGCVFAIIYNKPFVCLGNEDRGTARFDSLLHTFGLQGRLITEHTPEKVQRILQTPIDWEYVNSAHDAERQRGIAFLKANLSE